MSCMSVCISIQQSAGHTYINAKHMVIVVVIMIPGDNHKNIIFALISIYLGNSTENIM